MSPSPREPIALVGIGCRFPGRVVGPESFWSLLRDEVDAISEVPPERFDLAAVYHPEPGTPGKISCRFGGFLAGIERFDAPFFGISPREAVRMDPQQRLLLETGWEALEDAGMPQERIPRSRAGVFLGMMANEYEDLMYLDPGSLELHGLNGGGRYGASGRLSFGLGLEGPSLTLDTACSSSLVTVHLACQSLRAGECDLALAGGSHLILHPNVSISLSQANILARDGRCKFGDARADGFVRGEGVGLVVLRRLADALADGDRIYAVIRGSAVNSDGNSNGAMATPSRATQEAMLREAYRGAGISPGEVSYIEAHGTGTSVGDRVELEALGAVLGEGRPAGRPCRVGSIKTNIGHTEGASGVAGMIKLALSLAQRTLPKSLHFVTPNPNIPWADLPLAVQAERTPWPEGPAVGGVNSFGLSGTNAHLVLAEPPRPAPHREEAEEADGEAHLVPLSARSPEALRALVRSWSDWLAGREAEPLAPVARAAALRRSHLEHRLAVVARTRGELRERLAAFLAGEERPGMTAGVRDPQRPLQLAFVFPGQGSQWIGMGRELLTREPVFRASMERCAQALAAEVDWSLLGQLEGTAASRLEEIDVIQPTLFAIQVSLAGLWRSWGIEPAALVGHSMGEVAAAHVAGALSLEDAARVICRRSRLLRRVSGRGAMALVDLSLERAAAAIAGREDRLSIAVSNSPGSTVLSGDPEAIEEVVTRLEEEGIFCRRIKVDVASHSPQMDPLRGDLLATLEELRPRAGSIPVVSTVTGERTGGAGFDAGYWVRNLRQPVLFAGAVGSLLAEGFDAFVEISPHPLLLPAVEQCYRHAGSAGVALPSLRRQEAERAGLLGSLGALWARGGAADWARLHPDWQRKPWAPLPTYPWQREGFWLPEAGRVRRAARGGHPLLGPGTRLAEPAGTHVWETIVDQGTPAWLADHRVHGLPVLPGAACAEMALAAAAEALGEGPHALADLRFESALTVPRDGGRKVQVLLAEEGAGGATLRIFSREEGEPAWTRNAIGAICPAEAAEAAPATDLDAVRARCGEEIPGEAFYRALRRRGLLYGPAFQGIESLRRRDGEAIGRLAPAPRDLAAYGVHPARLDAGFQLLLATLPEGEGSGLHLPVELRELRLAGPPATAVWAHARRRGAAADQGTVEGTVEGDLTLLDEVGNPVLEARGLRLRRRARDPRAELAGWLYEIRWESVPRAAGAVVAGPGLWLLFADAGGMADGLRTLLEESGERCLLVAPAASYGPLGARRVGIDPDSPQDFLRLLDELGGELPLRGVVHLWSLDTPPADDLAPETLERARTLGCVSVLHLVQALARRDEAAPRLWLVTDRAQGVEGAAAPAQAPLLGLGRVIAAEHPDLGCVRIDIDAREDPREALFEELRGGGLEDEVALRGGQRRVARLERRNPAEGAAGLGELDGAAFRSDATYLITGGLGGLGLSIARWMAGRGARSLVLAGRRGPSEEARAAIAAIEALGARVVTAHADVASSGELAHLLAGIEGTLPPLRGVLHAAGLLDDGILLELTADRFRTVMAPKVEGAWNLHRLTRGLPLDFFVLFSSAAAVLGTRGQGNYAAANAFLDALAWHRRSLGLPAQSIAWGAWAGVGLAAAREERGRRLAARGLGSFLPEQGHAALGLLLGESAAQVAVMDVDWGLWARHEPSVRFAARLARLAAEEEVSAAEPEAESAPEADFRTASDPAERQRLIEARLRKEAAAVLRLPSAQIDDLRSLTQLGLDSLMALELKGRIDAHLGASVQVTRLLKGLSFKQLVEQVRKQLGEVDMPVPASGGAGWEELEL